jgi:heptose I phosphotransferase
MAIDLGGEAWDDGEIWDDGRLLVNRQFAPLLRAQGLTTFAAFSALSNGEIVRRVGTRETRRLTLPSGDGMETLYVKRHGAPRWRDRIMPFLHFSRPIHGARNEWAAILRFARAGIPTMTPVAFGECGADSLLVTQGVRARCNLLELTASGQANWNELTPRVADIARRMHRAGFHHQDFYLNHLLLCEGEGPPDVRVIDLGRVRQRQRLSSRWIIKDLAQLEFSARRLSCRERLRFLRLYLGRATRPGDRPLIRGIRAKAQRIAEHTAKHGL